MAAGAPPKWPRRWRACASPAGKFCWSRGACSPIYAACAPTSTGCSTPSSPKTARSFTSPRPARRGRLATRRSPRWWRSCGAVGCRSTSARRSSRPPRAMRTPGSRGAIELITEHLVNDLAALMPRLTRHSLPLGDTASGEPVTISPHGTRMLIVGPSASGKSTLTGLLVERLIESGRSVLLVDPEGDYQSFAELERVVVLGGSSERVLPTPDELRQLLHQPRTSLVLNLSAMTRAEKVAYATKALGAVSFVRSTTGLPHWLILDEAHHIAPADGSPVVELLRAGAESLCMSTLQVTDLAPELRTLPNVVAATELDAFAAATRAAATGRPPVLAGPKLAEGEVAIAWLGDHPRAQRFRVAKRRVQHRRHVRKYTEGELPPDRSFYFRGPAGALNLRASNLVRFVELAEGVDEPTWAWHLGQHDYSTWARQQIKDEDLAGALAAVETADLPPAESRRRALDEIRARYTV